ncbi:TMEM175 family protein [Arachidicoccus sp.]|uniref:TMEM175 family protein n=1 Tax=Arachidicoccus sp. TaxID=1872624 RepID=UPI003D1B0E11
MNKNLLEAFSDGVFAIIITIMVLEIKVPHGQDFTALKSLIPVFFSYVLSFIYVGIYWNNHHHLLQSSKKVSGSILWANLHLLFWLSLLPFATGWTGENHFAPATMALYGFVLLMAGVAWWILEVKLLAVNGKDSVIAKAIEGHRFKEIISPTGYAIGIASTFWHIWVAGCIYILVAAIWLIPDRRIEKTINNL